MMVRHFKVKDRFQRARAQPPDDAGMDVVVGHGLRAGNNGHDATSPHGHDAAPGGQIVAAKIWPREPASHCQLRTESPIVFPHSRRRCGVALAGSRSMPSSPQCRESVRQLGTRPATAARTILDQSRSLGSPQSKATVCSVSTLTLAASTQAAAGATGNVYWESSRTVRFPSRQRCKSPQSTPPSMPQRPSTAVVKEVDRRVRWEMKEERGCSEAGERVRKKCGGGPGSEAEGDALSQAPVTVSSVMARLAGIGAIVVEGSGEGCEFVYSRLSRTSSIEPKTYEIDIDAGMRVNVSGTDPFKTGTTTDFSYRTRLSPSTSSAHLALMPGNHLSDRSSPGGSRASGIDVSMQARTRRERPMSSLSQSPSRRVCRASMWSPLPAGHKQGGVAEDTVGGKMKETDGLGGWGGTPRGTEGDDISAFTHSGLAALG